MSVSRSEPNIRCMHSSHRCTHSMEKWRHRKEQCSGTGTDCWLMRRKTTPKFSQSLISTQSSAAFCLRCCASALVHTCGWPQPRTRCGGGKTGLGHKDNCSRQKGQGVLTRACGSAAGMRWNVHCSSTPSRMRRHISYGASNCIDSNVLNKA